MSKRALGEQGWLFATVLGERQDKQGLLLLQVPSTVHKDQNRARTLPKLLNTTFSVCVPGTEPGAAVADGGS